MSYSTSTFGPARWHQPRINCPKHGIHEQIITSTIAGHEGHWCQICWLESLGPSLPLIEQDAER
jgi:hypothetical protein